MNVLVDGSENGAPLARGSANPHWWGIAALRRPASCTHGPRDGIHACSDRIRHAMVGADRVSHRVALLLAVAGELAGIVEIGGPRRQEDRLVFRRSNRPPVRSRIVARRDSDSQFSKMAAVVVTLGEFAIPSIGTRTVASARSRTSWDTP